MQGGNNHHRINLSFVVQKEKEQLREAFVEPSSEQGYTLEITIADTEIKLKKTISYLTDSYVDNLIQWCDGFRFACKQASWSDHAAVQVLKNMLSFDIYEDIKTLTSLESCLIKILHKKYPSEAKPVYLSRAKKINQSHYYLLESYFRYQEKALRKYFICSNECLTIQNAKCKEMFFKNLCPSTKIYFLENGIKTRTQAFEKARSIENLLIQLAEEDTLKEPTV
ncbi:hypothetical protein A0H76_1395 [Hepatospora eriocheir]|uniref:Uncharacterized protein n=1 Tax=Hepatospora eriocheir TaxID=1081669 RepID=A0A1X0QH51_9MICR|nr:hypothetical protein A0H76_1395 [Hepatospora eriocheir]